MLHDKTSRARKEFKVKIEFRRGNDICIFLLLNEYNCILLTTKNKFGKRKKQFEHDVRYR